MISFLPAAVSASQGPGAKGGATSQKPGSTAPGAPDLGRPIGDLRQLLLDVEANEKRAEAAQLDYTYHVHTEAEDLDGKGQVKKTTVTEAESLTLEGVRVNRVVSRNGKALTPEERSKQDQRIDKQVEQRKGQRRKLQEKGAPTDGESDAMLPASRVLELGSFSQPRRELLDGRLTIVLAYEGDSHAKTRNTFEGIVRDLVGTVWIDETDRVLVRGEGQFRDDFKIAAGLLVDVDKGTHFAFRATRQGDAIWLPSVIDGTGSARFLLVEGFNGRIHVVTSDYRRFRAKATILASSSEVGPDDQPLPPPATATESAGAPPDAGTTAANHP